MFPSTRLMDLDRVCERIAVERRRRSWGHPDSRVTPSRAQGSNTRQFGNPIGSSFRENAGSGVYACAIRRPDRCRSPARIRFRMGSALREPPQTIAGLVGISLRSPEGAITSSDSTIAHASNEARCAPRTQARRTCGGSRTGFAHTVADGAGSHVTAPQSGQR